jgi:hypothetical protein
MLFYIVSLLTSIEYISMFREICVGSGSFSSLVSEHIPPDWASSALLQKYNLVCFYEFNCLTELIRLRNVKHVNGSK